MTPEQRAELRKAAEEATPVGYLMPHYEEYPDVFMRHPLPKGYSAMMAREVLYNANPATILQLLDYVESLERCAARYRYLRDDGEGFDISVLDRDTEDGELWVHGYPPEELDDAIDAAMGESK